MSDIQILIIICGVLIGLLWFQVRMLQRQYSLLFEQYKELYAMYLRIEKKVFNFNEM